MAVEKVYTCDLCGQFVKKADLRLLSFGLLSDRPEDYDRLDIGPECHDRPAADLLKLWYEKIPEDARREEAQRYAT